MPPRKPQQPFPSVPVKQEPLCVHGLRDTALANQVRRTLSKAPCWLRDYYDKKVKYSRNMDNAMKKKFIENLLNTHAADIESNEYFSKLHATIHQEAEGSKSEWISWKKLLKNDDLKVVTLALEQGRIQKRPHADLDPNAPETLLLDEPLRYQYKHVIDFDFMSTSTKGEVSHKADGEPPEVQMEQEEFKKVQEKLHKIQRLFRSQQDDVEARLDIFKGNEYAMFYSWFFFEIKR